MTRVLESLQRRRLDDLELGDDRLAHALDLQQPLARRGDRFGETAEARDQRLGQGLDVAPGNGGEQSQFQQFVIGHRLRAARPETLAQPLAMAEIMGRGLEQVGPHR